MEKSNTLMSGVEADNLQSFKKVEEIEGEEILKKIKLGNGKELILLGKDAVIEVDEDTAEAYLRERFNIDIKMLINIVSVIIEKNK